MTRLIGGVVASFFRRAAHKALCYAARDAAFFAIHAAASVSGKQRANIIHLGNRRARKLAKFNRGVLIYEICAALYGVVGVEFIRIAATEARNAVDTAFRHTGGVARRHHLRSHNYAEIWIALSYRYGCTQTRASRADNEYVHTRKAAFVAAVCAFTFVGIHAAAKAKRADADTGGF